MYYEYWGLTRAPFDNVPDPSMYVDSHASVENAVAETLFAIEEGNECVAVIVGEVGSGKTLSLRLILDALNHDNYRIAFITNPDMSFVQLLREIIGQIIGRQFEAGEQAKRKIDLLEIFNKLLFQTMDEGKKVLIFIDEANAISPSNLESLRLLTNMQDDSRNLFTMVLAGQMELAKRLEHPRRANLFQRIGTYNKIEKIESPELVRDYVQKRLHLAGGRHMFFTDDAVNEVWKYSEQGVPRLINKICKLCMKAGETNGFRVIQGDLVRQVGERFEKLVRPASTKQAAQKRTTGTPAMASRAARPQRIDQEVVGTTPASVVLEAEPVPVVFETTIAPVVIETVPAPAVDAEAPAEPREVSGEAEIESAGITIDIPPHILEQARSCTRETRMKLAGALAAETLQRHPQFTFPSLKDPVAVWNDIRNSIFDTLERQQAARSA